MPRSPKMSAPVTHGELKAELKKFKAELREELVTKVELREVLSNYPTKADLREALANHPTHADLEGWGSAIMVQMDRRFADMQLWISRELARQFKSSDEAYRAELAIIDEKYADLPDRVTALEAKR